MQGRDDIARIASARAVEIASRAISLASSVKGEKGDKGEPGEIVLKNVPVPGEKGEQGDKGDRGYTGAQGEKGEKGDKGDRGTDAVGAKGDKGDKGDTGLQGERGFVGPRGFKGEEGERGLTGPIPKHEIKGLKFRFQQDDGDWGKWIIVPTGGGGGGRDDKLFDRQKELMEIADAYKSNTNPFPVVYPSAGIPNSTGSAWGTSYGTTGTGNVVLNSNPTFATDITVNGLTVGKGDSNISTNTAFGVDAIGSPYIQSTNINNVGIGYNALNQIGSAVATLNSATLVGGSGYDDFYDGYTVGLVYLSGTPPQAGVTNPEAAVSISGGQIVSVNLNGGGFGWTALDTVFAINNTNIGGVGSGASIQIGSLTAGATNITAVGFGAGNSKTSASNSVYIGSGATGTGSNEIVIGANATGFGNNTVALGNASTTNTTFRGTLNAAGNISFTGAASSTVNIGTAIVSGAINIGKTNGTGTITLGQSTTTQTVNVHTGVLTSGAKTLNLGSNATGGTTTIGIGVATGVKTINIGTGASGISTIELGSTPTGSKVTLNGTVILSRTATPASATATGTAGTISWDANYIYICTATNTWKRVAISTW